MQRFRYAQRNQSLTNAVHSLHFSPMEWKELRSAFIRARGRRTQQAIAKAAGLGQGDISKLESNDQLGPTVGTFVKAVEHGLQIPLSDFFLQIENKSSGVTSPDPSVRDKRAPSISEAIDIHGAALHPDTLRVLADAITHGIADAAARLESERLRETAGPPQLVPHVRRRKSHRRKRSA